MSYIANGFKVRYSCGVNNPRKKSGGLKSCPFEITCKKDLRETEPKFMLAMYRSEHNHPL